MAKNVRRLYLAKLDRREASLTLVVMTETEEKGRGSVDRPWTGETSDTGESVWWEE